MILTKRVHNPSPYTFLKSTHIEGILDISSPSNQDFSEQLKTRKGGQWGHLAPSLRTIPQKPELNQSKFLLSSFYLIHSKAQIPEGNLQDVDFNRLERYDNNGFTFLHYATLRGNEGLVSSLLSKNGFCNLLRFFE